MQRNIITMQCFCTESHCGCEDVIQEAITNATAQLERELAAITNVTAQLEQELAAIINNTITNVTAQLEGELTAKFQQQSQLMVSLNEEISEKILWELSNNHQRVISSIEDHHPRSGTSMENPATSCNTLPHGSVPDTTGSRLSMAVLFQFTVIQPGCAVTLLEDGSAWLIWT